MCWLKTRQTRCPPSLRSFHEGMSCSQRKVVTANLVGKEAMVSLGCLAQLAETPLSTPKLLSVMNPVTTAAILGFADPDRLVVPVVTAESECKVAPSSLVRF
jgi:hypothetical protein